MRSLVISIFLYACESWTLTAELQKRTQALKMKCYRRLLNISYKDPTRSSGLAKTDSERKRGRQKKRLEDNIREWTGMDFASTTRAAESRTRWKGLVANSFVVPRQPSKVME